MICVTLQKFRHYNLPYLYPLHTGMPSQTSDSCLQETSCSKYNFSSLCKGSRVGTCCQGFECSNGLYSRVLWECSLWWWGHCPALLSPLAPCSPSLVGWSWYCCFLMPLSKGDHQESSRDEWNFVWNKGITQPTKVLPSDLSMLLALIWGYSQYWREYNPCSFCSPQNGSFGIPNLDAQERPELDNVSVSVQWKKYQAGHPGVTTCSSTTALNLPVLSWLMKQSHSAKAVVPSNPCSGIEPHPCRSRESTHPPDCYNKCLQTGHLIG